MALIKWHNTNIPIMHVMLYRQIKRHFKDWLRNVGSIIKQKMPKFGIHLMGFSLDVEILLVAWNPTFSLW